MFKPNIGVKTVKWEIINKHSIIEKKKKVLQCDLLPFLSLKRFYPLTSYIFGYFASSFGLEILFYIRSFWNLFFEFTTKKNIVQLLRGFGMTALIDTTAWQDDLHYFLWQSWYILLQTESHTDKNSQVGLPRALGHSRHDSIWTTFVSVRKVHYLTFSMHSKKKKNNFCQSH